MMRMPSSPDFGLDLLEFIPMDARELLLLGRNITSTSEDFHLLAPQAKCTFANICSQTPNLDREYRDNLILIDGKSFSDAEIARNGLFDAILVGNVLEHLPDPCGTICRLHGLLNSNGHLVLCGANISHWCRLFELFAGCRSVHDYGQFDWTHLRFFTQDMLINILRECGFEVLKIRPRNFAHNHEVAEHVIPVLSDAAEHLGLDRQAFVARANTLQYVLVARKAQPARPARMLRLHLAAMAPQFLDVRTRLPAKGIDSLPDVVVTQAEKTLELPVYAVDVPKICVLQRLSISSEAGYLNWVRDRVSEGWLLVAESDDHPALLAAVHGRDPAKESWLTVTGVHAVQTSTPALAEAYRVRNPEIATFPNAVFSLPHFVERRGPLRVFLGALNRERVTVQVARSLDGFCKAHPDVEFVVVHDRAFFGALTTERKTFHPAASYDAYLNLMGGCHVALMPLEGTFGETFKSDVKFLEASSRGTVSIASPTVYAQTILDGDTGLIAREMADWARLLGCLASSNDLRQCLARNAWEYVKRERMFAAQVATRRDWYNSLWDRREELNASLAERHPEILARHTA